LHQKKPTIIVQARTGSRRLPKKVIALIEKKPLIWHVINRLKHVKKYEQIVLCTTKSPKDDVLVELAKKSGINYFRGSSYDVLDRFYYCLLKFNADPIIRITGDCPLIDPKLIDKLLDVYNKNKYDYVTNNLPPTFPDGLDIEIFSFKTLEKTYKNAKLKSEREHVTPYIRNHSQKFKIYNLKNRENLSHLRWTVDESKDLKLVRKIYSLMKPSITFDHGEILKAISKFPSLTQINQNIIRNKGYLKSLKNDKKKISKK